MLLSWTNDLYFAAPSAFSGLSWRQEFSLYVCALGAAQVALTFVFRERLSVRLPRAFERTPKDLRSFLDLLADRPAELRRDDPTLWWASTLSVCAQAYVLFCALALKQEWLVGGALWVIDAFCFVFLAWRSARRRPKGSALLLLYAGLAAPVLIALALPALLASYFAPASDRAVLGAGRSGFDDEERLLARWIAALCAFGALLIAINGAFFRFTGIVYFPKPYLPTLPAAIFALLAGNDLRDLWPRASRRLRDAGWYTLVLATIALLSTGIQLTPFPTIDARLAAWDRALGVDVAAAMRWTRSAWGASAVFESAYDAFFFEGALPVLIALLVETRRMHVFLRALLYSTLAGYVVYYFFPSSGPASVMPSPYFTAEQQLTHLKFAWVHARQPIPTVDGGMIAFPSFHVAWGVLLTYLSGERKWLFYPVALLNGLMIAATVALGWHYLVDAIAGFAVAGACLWAAQRTFVPERPVAGLLLARRTLTAK